MVFFSSYKEKSSCFLSVKFENLQTETILELFTAFLLHKDHQSKLQRKAPQLQ